MTKENISEEFILKEIDKTTNYFIEKIKQKQLINKKYKNFFKKVLNYTEHLLILDSTVFGCVSMSDFP